MGPLGFCVLPFDLLHATPARSWKTNEFLKLEIVSKKSCKYLPTISQLKLAMRRRHDKIGFPNVGCINKGLCSFTLGHCAIARSDSLIAGSGKMASLELSVDKCALRAH